MKTPGSLSWLSEGRDGVSRERADLADGTLLLDPPNRIGVLALRFCPHPPAGVAAADVARLADAYPRGSPAWHRARAYDPRHGSLLGYLYDRYLAYQIIQEARTIVGQRLSAGAIRAAGFKPLKPSGDDPHDAALHARRVSHGSLRLTLRPENLAVHFDRARTRTRTLVAILYAAHRDAEDRPHPAIWPDGWGDPDHLTGLALFAQAWAERCGVTGPADLVLPRKTGSGENPPDPC